MRLYSANYHPSRRSSVLTLVVFLCAPALAAQNSGDVVVAKAGLSFSITADWSAAESPEDEAQPPVSYWVRAPVLLDGKPYQAELAIRVTPIEPAAELLDLTVAALKNAPFQTTLGAAECLKCVTALLPRPGIVWLDGVGPTKRFAAALSYKDWPDCELGSPTEYHGSCIFERIQAVELNVEPSWVFRFDKDTAPTAVDTVAALMLVEQTLVVVSFSYPLALRDQLTREVFTIIASMRRL